MHPIILDLGIWKMMSFTIHPRIYGYGLMLALGVLVALFAMNRLVQTSREFTLEDLIDVAIIAVFSGVIGSRLFYVVFYDWAYFAANPLQIINPQVQGLVFYGGFLFGALGVSAWAWRKGKNPWKLADIVAPGLMLAYGIGRIGCFLNGCCYGKPTEVGWGLLFPTADIFYRHPTQLYESAAAVLLFVILCRLYVKRTFDGQVLWAYVLLYAVERFSVEFLRENLVVWHGLTIAQVTAMIMALIAIPAYYWLRNRSDQAARFAAAEHEKEGCE
ncbi:MAG: prolipoprotein diacylglyceryl transferase [Solirubrobacterales bacterium]